MPRKTPLFVVLMLASALLQAQGTPPPSPLTLVSRDGRRAVPTVMLNGQELIALDDVASLFQVTVREDALAGGLTVTYRGRSVIVSTDQPMASVAGRVVALPAPAVRGAGRRWMVPVEFLPRALAPIYDTRIDLRRASRLLILGDVRVPRVTARVEAAGPPTRAIIEISPAAGTAIATEAGRLVIGIEADALDLALPADGDGLIDAIRPGEAANSVAVVLNPGAGVPRAASATADGVTRVTVDVPASAPTETAAPAPAPPPPITGLPPLVGTGPRPVLQTIVIDPGHGGMDAGVRGAGGLEEKTVTLEVARRLRGLVEARLGIRVILTRDDDRTVGVDERAAMANNSKADLFLSLHANAAPAAEVTGAEVYHLRLDREGEEVLRSAQAGAVSVPVLGGGQRTIDVIRWDLAQAPHVTSSTALASMLEESLRARVPMGARPIQNAPLRVLSGANMPAVLIEMAYLTNPQQEQLARSAEYQDAIAQAVYDAIVRFRAYLEENQP